jgi:phosphatidylserine decarboxylase
MMFYWILWIIPKKVLSRGLGVLAEVAWPQFLLQPLLRAFVSYYGINLKESRKTLAEFRSFNDLFTRELKAGVRPVGEGPFVHPADSVLVQAGWVESLFYLQAKKVPYTVAQLLPGYDTTPFKGGGQYALYYLCPRDYHRVHSPVKGQVLSVTHVPGLLWPVNQWSSENIEGLFYKNERLIVSLQTTEGLVVVILVAATNVGQMSLSFDSTLREKCLKAKRVWTQNYENNQTPLCLEKGQELGTFHMGSTVIVLAARSFYENTGWSLTPPGQTLNQPLPVYMGQRHSVSGVSFTIT